MLFFTIIYTKNSQKVAEKVTKNKKIIFELNYRPENAKEMQKNCFYLIWVGSFLVFKK